MSIISADGRAMRALASIASSSLILAAVAVGTVAAPTWADTVPPAGLPATVSADGLPTWQVNGVVWNQVVVGDTVYVAGDFTKARPPGAAPGDPREVDANNAFAYNIETGERVASFSPQFNAQTRAVAATPDGSTVIFGGEFTTVNGLAKWRIAAFDTATNALRTSFTAAAGSRVLAIAATNSTVYLGGDFKAMNGTARDYLAAVTVSTGALTSWDPGADSSVTSMVVAPDSSRLIVGGRFQNLASASAVGMGSVKLDDGSSMPWAANQKIKDYGTTGTINSLFSDGTLIYGSGYTFNTGGPASNFEGTFAADPYTGEIKLLNNCHGDTYSVFVTGQVLYSASHNHTCEWMGAYKNTDPWTMHYAQAFTNYATTTATGPDDYGWNYSGMPSSTLLDWEPRIAIGTFTGQSQAVWSVTGNSDYVVYGGEFPSVNSTPQYGLVRFARSSIAPNLVGPVFSSIVAPSANSFVAGQVRLTWPAGWDRDNATLTYQVMRDGTATSNIVNTQTQTSRWWQLPGMAYVDSGLEIGSSHTYRIRAIDPFGNRVTGPATTVTVSSTPASQYLTDVLSDGASNYWRLGEPSGSSAGDYAGFAPLGLGSGTTRGATGAIIGDNDGGTTFNGQSNGTGSTATAVDGPNVFSVEAWVRTSSSSGGKIVGFGNRQTGNSGSYDRHLYMTNDGRIIFGVYNNSTFTVSSNAGLNDGQYHHVVGTLSPAGMVLYVDGKKVGTNGGTTIAQPYSGYWRVGGDNLGSWPNRPSKDYLSGTIDDVAIYPSALTLSQVQTHFIDSGRSLNLPPMPTDSYGVAVMNLQPDLYWRLDEASGTTAVDASRNGLDGVYSGGYTLGQPSAVTGGNGTSVGFGVNKATIGSVATVSNPTTYTESAWFKTTTSNGGKIIGLGNAQAGESTNYDRHVWMENSGQLSFGTWTGSSNIATSAMPYNDGNWHQVIATQDSSNGMRLFVDGQLVATNLQTQAQSYSGYWRVGGDTTWSGNSNYFAGQIDEVAIWNTLALSPSQVIALYKASPVAPNLRPVAVISDPVSCTGLSCTFDGSTSTDPDGAVAGYSWSFSDGGAGNTASVTHVFPTGGSYTATLVVTDNQGGESDPVTRTVNVNRPPVADEQTATVEQGQSIAIMLDGTDPDGQPLTYAIVDEPIHGSLSGSAPAVMYTAPIDFTGQDAFTFTVDDGEATSAPATVRIDVTAPNQAPSAVDQSITTMQDTPKAITLGGTDPENDHLDFVIADQPQHGTLSGTAPHVIYTPNSGFSGSDEFTFTVSDGTHTSAAGTVSIQVTAAPQNQPPVASDSAVMTSKGTSVSTPLSASDPEGAPLTYSVVSMPTHGTLSGSGAARIYTPDAGFAGTDSFTFKANDGSLDSNIATVSVTVSNQAPTASAQAVSLVQDSATVVTLVGEDADGDALSYVIDSGPSHGSLSGSGASRTYTPASGYVGSDSFTFHVNDGLVDSSSATVSITVTATPAGGVFAADAFDRTVTDGWGSADTGGPWTRSGAASLFSVGSGSGSIEMVRAGQGPAAFLNGLSKVDTDLRVSFTTDQAPTGGGVYGYVFGRRVSAGNDYRAKVRLQANGAVSVILSRTADGTETTIAPAKTVSGLTFTPGMQLRVRLQVTGTTPTTVRVKVWKVGESEPTAWTLTATDSTPVLQAAGGIGLGGYLSGSATNAPVLVTFDDLQAGPTQ